MNTAIQTDIARRATGLSRNRAAIRRRRRNIALWILQGLLAAAFVMAGFSKVSGSPMMVASFEQLGMGQSFRYLTGSIEVVFGALLLVPLFAPVAASILLCTMLGAILAHLTKLGGSPIAAIVLGILCAVIAWYRWSDGATAAPVAPVRVQASL